MNVPFWIILMLIVCPVQKSFPVIVILRKCTQCGIPSVSKKVPTKKRQLFYFESKECVHSKSISNATRIADDSGDVVDNITAYNAGYDLCCRPRVGWCLQNQSRCLATDVLANWSCAVHRRPKVECEATQPNVIAVGHFLFPAGVVINTHYNSSGWTIILYV